MPAYLHSTQGGGGEHCLNNEVIKEWGKDGREWNFGFCLGADGDGQKSAPRQELVSIMVVQAKRA